VQPRAQGITDLKPPSGPSQRLERCLKCILGLVTIAQDDRADPQDHGTMSLDECAEREIGGHRISRAGRREREQIGVVPIS
jgi:hypothetical protein